MFFLGARVCNNCLHRACMLSLRKPSPTCKLGMSPQCVLFWCRQTGLIGGLLVTIVIWSIEVAVLCLLIRTTEKYKTKSYQVNSFFPERSICLFILDNLTSNASFLV